MTHISPKAPPEMKDEPKKRVRKRVPCLTLPASPTFRRPAGLLTKTRVMAVGPSWAPRPPWL